MALVVGLQRGGPDVIAAPPDLHLVLAKSLCRLPFVQALQRAVVPLVEPPAATDRYPGPAHLGQREVSGLDGADQDRCVDDGWRKAGSLHQPACIFSLGEPKLAHSHVGPPCAGASDVPRAPTIPDPAE